MVLRVAYLHVRARAEIALLVPVEGSSCFSQQQGTGPYLPRYPRSEALERLSTAPAAEFNYARQSQTRLIRLIRSAFGDRTKMLVKRASSDVELIGIRSGQHIANKRPLLAHLGAVADRPVLGQ